jgi:hypothetical protein
MEESELYKLTQIINDFKNKSNKDLVKAMDFLNSEFETTKEKIITLSIYLDKVEKSYNSILKEMNSRNGGQ